MDNPGTHCELCGLGGVSACLPSIWGGGGLQCQHLLSFWFFRNSQSSRIGKALTSSHCPRPPLVSRSLACTSSAQAASGCAFRTLRGHLRTPAQAPSSSLGLHPLQPGPGLIPCVCCLLQAWHPPPTLQPPNSPSVFGGGLWLWTLCVSLWPPGTLFPVHPKETGKVS